MLVNPIVFILAVLATHRISMMLTEDEGPLSIFTKLRGRLDPDQTTWLGRGVNCIMCVGVWVALLITIYLYAVGVVDLYLAPLAWLGLAGAVVILRRWEQKR